MPLRIMLTKLFFTIYISKETLEAKAIEKFFLIGLHSLKLLPVLVSSLSAIAVRAEGLKRIGLFPCREPK